MKKILSRNEFLKEKAGEVEVPEDLLNSILNTYLNRETNKGEDEEDDFAFLKEYRVDLDVFLDNSYLVRLGKYVYTVFENMYDIKGSIIFTKKDIIIFKNKTTKFPDETVTVTFYLNMDIKKDFGSFITYNIDRVFPNGNLWKIFVIGLKKNMPTEIAKNTIRHELIHAKQHFNSFLIAIAKQILSQEEVSKQYLLKIFSATDEDGIYGAPKQKTFSNDYILSDIEYKPWLSSLIGNYLNDAGTNILSEAKQQNLIAVFIKTAIKNILKNGDGNILSIRKEFVTDLSKALINRIEKFKDTESITTLITNRIKALYPHINNAEYIEDFYKSNLIIDGIIEVLRKDIQIKKLAAEYVKYFGKSYDMKKLLHKMMVTVNENHMLKYIKNNHTNDYIFYHGAAENYNKLNTFKSRYREDELSDGCIFLSEDINTAEAYANNHWLYYIKVISCKLFDYEELLDSNGDYTDLAYLISDSIDDGSLVLPSKIDSNDNFFIIEEYLKNGDWDIFESKGFKDWFIKNGYDGFWICSEFGNTSYRNLAILNVDVLELVKVVNLSVYEHVENYKTVDISIPYYHGSKEPFEFNEYGGYFSGGTFFTPDEKSAKHYGKYIKKVFFKKI